MKAFHKPIDELVKDLNQEVIKTQKSEAKMSLILNSTEEAIYGVDLNGLCTFVNSSFLKILGYDDEKYFIGKSLHKIISHSYEDGTPYPRELCNIELSILSTEKRTTAEKVLWKKDGTSLHVEFSSTSLTENGEITGAVVTFKDITEKINFYKEMEHNHNLMTYIIDNIKTGIAIHDNNLKYLYVSKQYLRNLNIKDEDVIGKYLYDVFPDLPQRWMDSHARSLKGEVIKENRDCQVLADGTTIYTRFETRPWYNEDGSIGGIVIDSETINEQVEIENELRYEKELAQQYLDLAGTIIVVLDKEGNVSLVNKKGCNVIGMDEKDIIGKNWFEHFIPKEIVENVKGVFENVLSGEVEMAKHFENILITANNNERLIAWNNNVLYDLNGDISGLISSGEDITESTIKQRRLLESYDRLDRSQKISNVGSWELNLKTNLIWASQEAHNIYELPVESGYIDISKISKMVSFEDKEILDETLMNLIQHGNPYNVYFTLNIGTKMKHIHSKASVTKNSLGEPIKVLGVIRDITELKQKEDELTYISYHDSLTGLNNRRYYEDNLVKLDIPENYPLTIVMSDINGLKLVNDAFGQDAGDKLLKAAAKVISDSCRETDLVARIGGDEFIMVLPNTSEIEAEKIIDKINVEAKKINIESIELSISFGFKTKNDIIEDIKETYISAEDLMYRVKLIEIPSMRSGAIETILNTLYEKDKNSEAHSRTVSSVSEKIAFAYGMNRQEVAEVKTAGLLHDIGKIIIPTEILIKEGKLTVKEYDLIKGHPEIGFRILNSTNEMRNISNIVLSHHERWDGFGYPRGIKTEDIPLQSRIIAIADAFDAMTSVRTYQKISSNEEALNEIIRCSGTQFDPELVKVFTDNFKTIIEIK